MTDPQKPPLPPPPPNLGPTPEVDIVYRELPNGARIVLGLRIGGMQIGGVVAVDTGFDITRPSSENGALVRVKLETYWRFKWIEERDLGNDLVVATSLPPEPPKNVRPGPGFRP